MCGPFCFRLDVSEIRIYINAFARPETVQIRNGLRAIAMRLRLDTACAIAAGYANRPASIFPGFMCRDSLPTADVGHVVPSKRG